MSGAKKLIIKSLKKGAGDAASGPNGTTLHLNNNIAEGAWPTLKDFVDAVHSVGYTRHSLQELYRAIEDAVTARQGAVLYERLTECIRTNASNVIKGLLSSGSSKETVAYLAAVSQAWSTHCAQLVMIRNVFLYLDRTYVRDTKGAQPILCVLAAAAAAS